MHEILSSITGIGISMGHVSAVTVVSLVFTGNQKPLCITVHATCATLTAILYPYILKWLAEIFYLRGTFLVLGGAYLNNFVFFIITFLHKSTFSVSTQVAHELRRNGDGLALEKKCICLNVCHILETWKKVLTKQIVCLLMASGLTISTMNTLLQFVFDIADWKGFDESDAKEFYVMLSCSNVLATITPGILKQRYGFNMYICLIITALCGCTGNLLVLLSGSYALNSLGMCLIGLIAGGIVTSSMIIILDTTSLDQVGLVTGLFFTVNGLLSASGGPLFGNVFF